MPDDRKFVQFIHPGGEHRPDRGRIRTWNAGPHRRKFLLSEADVLIDGETRREEVVFWGEWEPESEVVREIAAPLPDGPRYVHRPFWVEREDYDGLQNTDPFVFGERICYTCCQQRKVCGETFLRRLDRGSVVLFGSCRRGTFLLDTVFVVDSWTDHDRRSFWDALAGDLHPTYRSVTFEPWYGQKPGDQGLAVGSAHGDGGYRLYRGATAQAPVEGMFSYFPCQIAKDAPLGFERPIVPVEGVTGAMRQGKRGTSLSLAEIKARWDEVAAQVLGEGLRLGLSAAMPPRVEPR